MGTPEPNQQVHSDHNPDSPKADKSGVWLWEAWPYLSGLVFPVSVLIKIGMSPGWEMYFFLIFGLPIWAVLALASWGPKRVLAKRGFSSAPKGVATALLLHYSFVYLTLFCFPGISDVDRYSSPLTLLTGSNDATGTLRSFNDNLLYISSGGVQLSLCALWGLALAAKPSGSEGMKLKPGRATAGALAVLMVVVAGISVSTAPEPKKGAVGRTMKETNKDAVGRTTKQTKKLSKEEVLEINRQQWDEQQEDVAAVRKAMGDNQWYINSLAGAQKLSPAGRKGSKPGGRNQYVIVSTWSTATAMDLDEAHAALESTLSGLGYRETDLSPLDLRFYTGVLDYAANFEPNYVAIWEREDSSESADSPDTSPYIRVTVVPNMGMNLESFPEATSLVRIQAESGPLPMGGHMTYVPSVPAVDDPSWQHPADRTYEASQWPSFEDASQIHRQDSQYQPPICWTKICLRYGPEPN